MAQFPTVAAGDCAEQVVRVSADTPLTLNAGVGARARARCSNCRQVRQQIERDARFVAVRGTTPSAWTDGQALDARTSAQAARGLRHTSRCQVEVTAASEKLQSRVRTTLVEPPFSDGVRRLVCTIFLRVFGRTVGA